MKKIILLLLILTAFTITNSCKRDKHIPNICFERDILPIFIVKCTNTGCHGNNAQDGLAVLTNYNDIIKAGVTPYHSSQSEIFSNIKGKNPSMPKSGSPQLTAKEVDLIKSWIDFGALNTSCGTGTSSTSTCDTLDNNTYTGKIKAIIDVNCNGCHFTGNSQSTHILDNYNGLKTSVLSGKLELAIKHLSSKKMPQSAAKLPDCKIAQIDKWIKLGMPEN